MVYLYTQRVLFSHGDKNNNCGVLFLFSPSFDAVANGFMLQDEQTARRGLLAGGPL